MNFHPALDALAPWKKLLIGFAVALLLLIALFDWNWLRRPLVWYVSERSGRDVRIDDLHVELPLTLEITVRLRGVHVPNADWASTAPQPLAVAREASFTLSLKSAWERLPVVSRLVLVDADVVLERRADGLRNWRLFSRDAQRPGLRILTLEAHRSRIRFVREDIELDVVTAASPLEPAESMDGQALTSRIDFKGRYRGAEFAGVARTGPFVSFRHSGSRFPIRGHAVSRKSRLEVDGELADFLELGTIDARVRVAGPSLALLHPFLPVRPGASRPYDARGWVKKTDGEYGFERLRARIGDTEITGDASYRHQEERSFLTAALRSEDASWPDLRPLLGLDEARASEPLMRQPLRGERLKIMNANLRLEAKKLKESPVPALEGLRVTAKLTDGLLELDPIDARVAGGRVAGSLTFDARRAPLAAAARLAGSDIRLERLVPSVPAAARGLAPVRARIRLKSQGDSIAAMLAAATGTLTAFTGGGSISNLTDAKIGLNRMKVLGLMLRGDRQIPVNCGAIDFDVRGGTARSRTLVLDTAETRTLGAGTVDLGARKLDILLTPAPKKPAVFAREKSIRLQGSFDDVHFSLVDRAPTDGDDAGHRNGELCAELAAAAAKSEK